MWFSSWLSKWKRSLAGGRRRTQTSSRKRLTYRPRLEALEDRCLLSTGGLDPTFGTGGKVTTDFLGPTIDPGREATAIQSDGKIVVAGGSYSTDSVGGGGFALARYTAGGSLDTTFGTGGKVIPTYSVLNGRPSALALQGDGKIVVVGSAPSGNSTDFALLRYNNDGSLDTSFGSGGEVLTSFGGSFDGASSVAIQGDGKIVVAGVSDQSYFTSDFALARYNSDGSLDTSFGNGGQVLSNFSGSDDSASAVAIQGDGRIVVAGQTVQNDVTDFAVARYTSNGSLDTSFGTGGEVATDFGGYAASSSAVALQSNGDIVAAGFSVPAQGSTGADFALARYTAGGSLDTTFGAGGKVTTDFGSLNEFGESVAIQGDGKIVAAGFSAQSGTGYDFALARYNGSDGSLDQSFASGGKALTDFGNTDDFATGVALQSNGDIVAAGTSVQPATSYDFAVARYTAGGSLDTTFGGSGTVTTNISMAPTDDYGKGGVALQADGKLVVAGGEDRSIFSGGFEFALARYNADGSLDAGFGSGGEVTTSFSGQALATSVAIQADGKIVLAGQTQGTNGDDFALVRYNADGSLDTTFGTGGKVTTDVGGYDDANSVTIQNDGKIVVAGQTFGSNDEEFALVRYNADGSLDTTFGTGGEVANDFSRAGGAGTGAGANGVTIQADGKIVAAGTAYVSKTSSDDFALARYNTNGSLDTTFGTGGEVLTSIGGLGDLANSVAIQSDGKIVASGTSFQKKVGEEFALVRYNADGSLDKTFGKGGEVVTNFGSSDNEAFAMALQGDGKIVVAGESLQSNPGYDFALARYNSDGSLDQAFGTGGLVLTDFGGISQAVGVVIQADGNIVAAGTADQSDTGFDFALARYIGASPSKPIDAIVANVQGLVTGSVLNNGQGNSLLVKLQNATEHLDDGQTTTAVNDLQAFVNEVNDYLGEDILTRTEGQLLIGEADAVIALLQKK